MQSLNYIFNVVKLIEKYELLYKDGISVDKIIKKYDSGELERKNLIDYSRFRIFLDSCLLLLNKERIEKNKNFTYKDYIKNGNTPKNLATIEIIKKMLPNYPLLPKYSGLNISDFQLFYSLDGKKYNEYTQGEIIRNAFAHAETHAYMNDEKGIIYYFFVDNEDDNGNKKRGIVIEEFFHEWVANFFSNYSTTGVPFKHTCISKYSYKNDSPVDKQLWVTFTSDVPYNGDLSHPMCELGKTFDNNTTAEYVRNHKDDFNIEEVPLDEKISNDELNILCKKYNLLTEDERIRAVKTIHDHEYMLSNFLVHICQLNNIIMGKKTYDKNSPEYANLKKGLLELKEDENDKLAFRLGFLYLKGMVLANRLEKKDFPDVDYSKINVDGFFDYTQDEVDDFCNKNSFTDNKEQHYVLIRLRNALMHGNISFEINKNGVVFVLSDIYYAKNKKDIISQHTIRIDEADFRKFLTQKALFEDIDQRAVQIEFSSPYI